MAEKYSWYFISLRPRDGITLYNTNKLLEWFKKHSTSLYIVLEGNDSKSHWHICLCWNKEITRSSLQSIYGKTLKSLLNLSLDELKVNTNLGALKIMYNTDVIQSYLSGNYINEFKDKSLDYFKIIYNNIDNEDYNKFKEIVKTNNIERRQESTFEKIIDYMKNNNIEFRETPNFIDKLFNHLHTDEIIPVYYNEFIEKKYKLITFHKLSNKKFIDYVYKYEDIKDIKLYIEMINNAF